MNEKNQKFFRTRRMPWPEYCVPPGSTARGPIKMVVTVAQYGNYFIVPKEHAIEMVEALEHYANREFWYYAGECETCKPYWAMNWRKKPEDDPDYEPYERAVVVLRKIIDEKIT